MLLASLGHVGRGGADGPGFLFPLLLLIGLFFAIRWLIRRRRGEHHVGRGHGSPMRTLQERFARGEIDRAEFEHRKAVLVGADEVPPAPHRPSPPATGAAGYPTPPAANPTPGPTGPSGPADRADQTDPGGTTPPNGPTDGPDGPGEPGTRH